jgi:uncharacterized membrane protein YczE
MQVHWGTLIVALVAGYVLALFWKKPAQLAGMGG